jgi:hypothetical protein
MMSKLLNYQMSLGIIPLSFILLSIITFYFFMLWNIKNKKNKKKLFFEQMVDQIQYPILLFNHHHDLIWANRYAYDALEISVGKIFWLTKKYQQLIHTLTFNSTEDKRTVTIKNQDYILMKNQVESMEYLQLVPIALYREQNDNIKTSASKTIPIEDFMLQMKRSHEALLESQKIQLVFSQDLQKDNDGILSNSKINPTISQNNINEFKAIFSSFLRIIYSYRATGVKTSIIKYHYFKINNRVSFSFFLPNKIFGKSEFIIGQNSGHDKNGSSVPSILEQLLSVEKSLVLLAAKISLNSITDKNNNTLGTEIILSFNDDMDQLGNESETEDKAGDLEFTPNKSLAFH